ncbi:MAG TPA: tetratricopeptide repeat protein, partial [Humisphaera sp.]
PRPPHPMTDTTPTAPTAPVAPAAGGRARRFDLAAAGGLVALVLVTFGTTYWNGFVNYDDPTLVTAEPMVTRGLSADGVAWAFTGFRFQNYHPLAWASHMLDVSLFGLEPGGHHLTSVALHAATAALVYLALRRMTGDRWPSLVVAALFAVHPLRVQSVAWVAERKDVLCAFFAALTLLAYERYARRPTPGRYGLVMLPYALGLLSKQMIVTLPFVLLLLDYWPLRRTGAAAGDGRPAVDWRRAGRLVLEKVPLLALAAAASVAIYLAQATGPALRTLDAYPLGGRLANAALACAAYLRQTVWPGGLAVFYPYPRSFEPAAVAAAVAALAAVTVAAVVLARRRPYLLVGWLWFLGMLVPVIGLVQVGRQSMADRYTYLPHVGLFVAVVWLVRSAVARSPRAARAAVAAAATVVTALAIWSVVETGYWRSSTALFARALEVTADNEIAHHQIAGELARAGDPLGAEEHYREAVRINPNYALAWRNLGLTYVNRRRAPEAVAALRRAIELEPDSADAHRLLGEALYRTGDRPAAEAAVDRAIALDPASATAHVTKGNMLLARGDAAAAAESYRTALRLKPGLKVAQDRLDGIASGAFARPRPATTRAATAPSADQ